MSLFPTQCLLFLLPMYPTYLFIVNILETWFRWCPPNPLANEVLLNLIRILSSKVIIHLDTVHIIPSPPNNHRERWKKNVFLSASCNQSSCNFGFQIPSYLIFHSSIFLSHKVHSNKVLHWGFQLLKIK